MPLPQGGSMRYALAFLIVIIPSAAFAHGGGLDGYGCHHNRKQGGYHCHRGPMAGQSFASQQEMLAAMKKGGTSKDTNKSGKR